jgi:hypothetical protein
LASGMYMLYQEQKEKPAFNVPVTKNATLDENT